jgi:hypothetical protein
MKGVIGGRKTSNKGGKYHMDDIPEVQVKDEDDNLIGIYNAKFGNM